MAMQRCPVIDVGKHIYSRHALAQEIRARVGERVSTRPANACKGIEKTWATPEAHEPIAAVGGRTEDGIVMSQGMERFRDVKRPNTRDIAANNHHRARWQCAGDTRQAMSEITPTLRDDLSAPQF